MSSESSLCALDEYWEPWPRCPGCAQPRQCVCPACHVAGVTFPLADYQAAPAPLQATRTRGEERAVIEPPARAEPLLRCPTCDEVFEPCFYRLCENCGHDFADGIDLTTVPREELTPRFFFLLACLLLTLGGMWLYFAWLLRR